MTPGSGEFLPSAYTRCVAVLAGVELTRTTVLLLMVPPTYADVVEGSPLIVPSVG